MKATGQKLLRYDRKLGARYVAGVDEAGRGPLAGPMVVAGVLLDYACLKEHRVRPLTYLNDSKQCSEEMREQLFRGVLECAEKIVVRVIPPGEPGTRAPRRPRDLTTTRSSCARSTARSAATRRLSPRRSRSASRR